MPLTPSELDELRRLAPLARTARRQHAPHSPQGLASARFTEILAAAFAEGRATARELSDASGISYHSVARRLRIATGSPVGARTAPPSPLPAETPGNPGEENPPSAQTGAP